MHRALLLRTALTTAVVTLSASCTLGGSVVPSAPAVTPTPAPAVAPTPVGSLDPTRSDAGVAARVTITRDVHGRRDGTHEIHGVAAEGSSCTPSFDGNEFTAVAWKAGAGNGFIHRFSVSVPIDDIPASDGQTNDVTDGRVSFDFLSESGIGTQYTGDATEPDEGRSTIDVTRTGERLTFDFEGATYVDVPFSGQLICAEAAIPD